MSQPALTPFKANNLPNLLVVHSRLDLAKRSAEGSVILFIGNIGSTALGAVALILVARFLGPENYGLFVLSIAMPLLLQLFTHFGTRTAATRFVAYHMSLGEPEKARRFAQSSILFSLIAGLAFSMLGYLSAGFVATELFGRPLLQPYIALASWGIVGQAVLLAAIASAWGWNSMGQAAFAASLQQGVRMVAAPGLVLLGFGLGGAVFGHVLSFFVAGAIAVALLYATRVKAFGVFLRYFFEDTRELITFGFLPFVGNALAGLSVFYVSLLLAVIASNAVIGYYQTAFNLIVPASMLSTATASALYPAFSSLYGVRGNIGEAFRVSVKYVGFVIMPVLFFLVGTSNEMMVVIYGSSYSPGSPYLVLLALAYVPILLGMGVIPNFFNGIGKTRQTLYAVGGGAVSLFALAPVLAIWLGLGAYGLIYATLISNVLISFVGLLFLRRMGMPGMDMRAALGTLSSSVLAMLVCVFIPPLGPDLFSLFVKFVLFASVYLTLVPMLGGLEVRDIERIRHSLAEVRLLGKLAVLILDYEEKLRRRVEQNPATSG